MRPYLLSVCIALTGLGAIAVTGRADDARIVDAVHIVGESHTSESEVILAPVHRVGIPADSAAPLPVSCTNTSCPRNAPSFCEADKYFTTCCTANHRCLTPVAPGDSLSMLGGVLAND